MSTHTTPPAAGAKGTAVVTGASAGIGKVYAERLAKRGYDLVLVARRADKLEALATVLRTAYGVAVRTIVADLGAAGDLEKVAADIAADVSITMLVNNAGTSTLAKVSDTTKEQLEALNFVNVIALARLSHAILPAFKLRDKGTLINIGSVLGFFMFPGSAAYSGTKGYVNNFTQGLQQDVAGTGVVVQLVLPATTATDIWEISGVPLENLSPDTIMSAEDCVDAALAGLDQGEAVTLPSVNDHELFEAYEAARNTLFAACQTGAPADRYQLVK